MSRATAPVAKGFNVKLTVNSGPCKGQISQISGTIVTIGRGPENNFVLPLDAKVSRAHLELHLTPIGTLVKSLSQKNQVLVDGELVIERFVKVDFSVQVGESEIRVERTDVVKENTPNLRVVDDPKSPIQTPNGLPIRKAESQLSKTQTGILSRPIGDGAVASQLGGVPSPHGGFEFNNGTGAAPGAFQSPPTGPSAPPASSIQNIFSNPRARFYLIVGVVGLIALWLFSGGVRKKKAELKLRDSVQSNDDYLKSEAEIKKIKDDPRFKAKESVQWQMAEQHFTRGMRDYRQGQWVRSLEAFQAALSFYPTHELARHYYTRAKNKFDQQVQFHMVQGKRYYGTGSFKYCMDEFRKVVIMKKDLKDLIRKEALQYYNECQLKMEQGK